MISMQMLNDFYSVLNKQCTRVEELVDENILHRQHIMTQIDSSCLVFLFT